MNPSSFKVTTFFNILSMAMGFCKEGCLKGKDWKTF